jgi:hypothetical protein
MNDLFTELTDMQHTIDQQQGTARLERYVNEQGLRDCQQNADAIVGWLQASNKNLSLSNADAAIAALRSTLLWGPETPVEVLEDWQLPLDASEAVQKKASVKALQDLVARRRKNMSKYHRPRGSFGASF